ncbi:phage virion morphogenesis protein [Psychrobacter pygoscelis]|uniref:phage virion morphogenesis protein n=1 Tax=Psychrobacter pygoscelis TaxID=2488563 RepID=UPI00103A2BF5|nr:phage virion morphogenesis protein [Psychrobacter pygoscelis]
MDVSVSFGGELSNVNLGSLLGMTPERMSQFGDLAGAQMVENTITRFENQASPDGVPWKPSRRAIAQGGETLRDTGRLMNSITFVSLPDGVEWGTNVIYAPIHQFGGVIRAKNGRYLRFTNALGVSVFTESVMMPARPYLGVSLSDIDELSEVLHYVLGSSNDR